MNTAIILLIAKFYFHIFRCEIFAHRPGLCYAACARKYACVVPPVPGEAGGAWHHSRGTTSDSVNYHSASPPFICSSSHYHMFPLLSNKKTMNPYRNIPQKFVEYPMSPFGPLPSSSPYLLADGIVWLGVVGIADGYKILPGEDAPVVGLLQADQFIFIIHQQALGAGIDQYHATD